MKKQMNSTKRKAFTLMELIIVIVIIGALTAIAVGKLAGSDKGAQIAAMKSDVKQAVSLMNAEYATNQAWSDVTGNTRLSPGVSITPANATSDSFTITATNSNLAAQDATCQVVYDNSTGQLTTTTTGC